jgi:hypothetical protein
MTVTFFDPNEFQFAPFLKNSEGLYPCLINHLFIVKYYYNMSCYSKRLFLAIGILLFYMAIKIVSIFTSIYTSIITTVT